MSNQTIPLSWKSDGACGFNLRDKEVGIYATIRKQRAWKVTPWFWETCLPQVQVQVQGRCKTVCSAKIYAKKEVLKLLAMDLEKQQCHAILQYAKAQGVATATLAKDPTYGWTLYGTEKDRKGYPIVWQVAEKLGIWRGVGSTGQCQVDLTKLKKP